MKDPYDKYRYSEEQVIEIAIEDAESNLLPLIKHGESIIVYFPLYMPECAADYAAEFEKSDNGFIYKEGGHGFGSRTYELRSAELVLDSLLKFNDVWNKGKCFHYVIRKTPNKLLNRDS
ncbi:hypothetical protein [Vibrio genomosp. F10]|uniref:hypothetical protein n=1 Tax=Vibrio genomosp. F10 TaxID=723171 RepID=UPI000313E011|nr:hypothetical protein [Vibrio genomosp. F10]OEF06153.1 hypothetical protein A1QI_18690 [Vibrio genomosp. F10 str. 9ZB36]